MNKNKIDWKIQILNFFTFGYIKRKALKISREINQDIQVSNEVSIDVNQLINFLGGIDNIKDVRSTITTLKINFINKQIIKQDEIKEIGAKGIIISDNNIVMSFGYWAKELMKQILDIKSKRDNNYEK
ncbi:MAG: hypothetical protein ACRCW6_00470 [Mycoplasmoidaceae bacterium]